MEAMERALRIYNGKPLINSVNGKRESMEAVFPLVKKYGGVVVALALDESGIPETAEGRLEVARKICDTAASYGIARKNILIDALCLTVSSDSRGAAVALETLRRVRQELGVQDDPGGVQHLLRPAKARGDQLRLLRHGASERPLRRHHQSRSGGDDERLLQLPGPDGAGSPVRRLH